MAITEGSSWYFCGFTLGRNKMDAGGGGAAQVVEGSRVASNDIAQVVVAAKLPCPSEDEMKT